MQKPSLSIITETADFIAVNKPAGMLTIPDREGKELSLRDLLAARYGDIFTVHRIDRGTSGVVLFARNAEAHRFLSLAFEERTVEKFYLGIATGTLQDKEGTIDAPIARNNVRQNLMIIHTRGKPSVTDYKVLEEFGKYSLVEFRIHTGRTHQVRIHMQYAGHPLACDELYGDGRPVMLSSLKHNYHLSKAELEEKPILSRTALHASRLGFAGPDGKRYDLEAELPKDIRALLQQLRKIKKHGLA